VRGDVIGHYFSPYIHSQLLPARHNANREADSITRHWIQLTPDTLPAPTSLILVRQFPLDQILISKRYAPGSYLVDTRPAVFDEQMQGNERLLAKESTADASRRVSEGLLAGRGGNVIRIVVLLSDIFVTDVTSVFYNR
jgi:hypothetical protein